MKKKSSFKVQAMPVFVSMCVEVECFLPTRHLDEQPDNCCACALSDFLIHLLPFPDMHFFFLSLSGGDSIKTGLLGCISLAAAFWFKLIG